MTKKTIGICLIVIGAILFMWGCLAGYGAGSTNDNDSSLTTGVIFIMVISLTLLIEGYILWSKGKKNIQRTANGFTTSEDVAVTDNGKKSYSKWIVGIIIFLVVTLPFHYVPTALMAFPKDNFTFSYTIITQDDIDQLIKRYNNCGNLFEAQSIRNEPLFRKLTERGLIYDKK